MGHHEHGAESTMISVALLLAFVVFVVIAFLKEAFFWDLF